MRRARITVHAAPASTKAVVTATAGQPRPQPVTRATELAKLQPMPKGRPGHINFKLVEPASLHHLLYRPRLPGNKVLNPNHPLANKATWMKDIPHYRSSLFQLHAIPNDLLAHADIMPPFDDPAPSLTQLYGPQGQFIRHRADLSRTDVVHMALSSLISKKGVHPSAVIRRTVARKLREAIRLIVARGAKPNASATQLVFDEQEGGEYQWLLQNHSYHIRPTLGVYRVAWPTLITDLRSALSTTKQMAKGKPTSQSGSFASRPHIGREKIRNQSAHESRTPLSSARRPATSTPHPHPHQSPSRSYSTSISPEAEPDEDVLRDYEASHGVLRQVDCEEGIPIVSVDFVDDFIEDHEADTRGCDSTPLPLDTLRPHNLIPDAAILDNKYKRYTLHKKMKAEWRGHLSPLQLRKKLLNTLLHNRRVKEQMMAERWGYKSMEEQEEMEERIADAIAERREPQPSGEDQPWWFKWKHREEMRQARRRRTWNLSRGTADQPSTWDETALGRGWGVPGQEFQHDSLLITRDIGRDEESATSTWVPPQPRTLEQNPWLLQEEFPKPQRDDEGYDGEDGGMDVTLKINTGPRVPWGKRDALPEAFEGENENGEDDQENGDGEVMPQHRGRH